MENVILILKGVIQNVILYFHIGYICEYFYSRSIDLYFKTHNTIALPRRCSEWEI